MVLQKNFILILYLFESKHPIKYTLYFHKIKLDINFSQKLISSFFYSST